MSLVRRKINVTCQQNYDSDCWLYVNIKKNLMRCIWCQNEGRKIWYTFGFFVYVNSTGALASWFKSVDWESLLPSLMWVNSIQAVEGLDGTEPCLSWHQITLPECLQLESWLLACYQTHIEMPTCPTSPKFQRWTWTTLFTLLIFQMANFSAN